MNPAAKKTLAILSRTPMVLIVIVVFALGYTFKGMVSTAPRAASTDAIEQSEDEAGEEIWTCSMHPQIRLPEPGKCPLCGMDLVLAAEESKPKTASTAPREPKYACSLFCVPPMSRPGKCPICGMEMVEVEDSGGGEGASRSLTLSPMAQKLAEIETVAVVRKTVSAEIRMVGTIDYDETRLGYITAWVPGRLDRLYVDYTGVPVQKGDHMAYLYSPELSTAQTELIEALQRTKPSSAGGSSLLNERAEAWLEDIREKFRLWGLTDAQIAEIEDRGTASDYMTIYAPMGGIVIHKNVLEGSYVKTGTRIYTIADLSHLWIKLDAYETDLAWLRYGQEVEFEAEAYPGETFTGTVAFIAPVLDAKTRTVKVRVNVENLDGRLKPEMFVRAVAHSEVAAGGRVIDAELAGKWMCPMHPEIVKEEAGDCDRCGMPLVRTETLGFVSIGAGDVEVPLVIPASAPLITGKRALVYVEVPDEPGTYQGREIRLGPRVGKHYIVFDGLEAGERVVVSGNFKIDSAMQIMAQPSMMSPEGGQPAPTHDHGQEQHEGSAKTDQMPSPRQDLDGLDGLKLNIPPAFAVDFGPVLAAYLKTQEALSHDKHAPAQSAAGELRDALARVDMKLLTGDAHMAWMKESVDMTKAASDIAESADIQKARAAFAVLSESMIVTTKCYGVAGESVHRFHCPMAFGDRGGDWLQTNDKTENPYFGSAMFRCGVKKETSGPRSAGGASDAPN
ncbi:MAG: efflux RND transporter periplasmic adaptor subunit [Phycisphaerae bacterium]